MTAADATALVTTIQQKYPTVTPLVREARYPGGYDVVVYGEVIHKAPVYVTSLDDFRRQAIARDHWRI